MKNFSEINRALVAKKKIFTLFAAALLTVSAVQAEVLLNEEVAFDKSWGTYRVLNLTAAPSLANVAKGDLFVVTVSAIGEDAATNNPQIAIQGSNWNNLDYNSGFSFTTTGSKTIVLLTDSAVTKVQEGGIIVKGFNCTITKVELLYQKNLWVGELGGNEDWKQGEDLNRVGFSDLKAGDFLGVTYDNLTDTLSNEWGHACVLRYDYAENIIDHWTNVAGTYVQALTEADITKLKDDTKNLSLVARWLVITSLNTYTATKTTTPIDNTNAEVKAVKFFKNGQLFILRDNKTYTLQGQRIQ